jgi:hypothetical protein
LWQQRYHPFYQSLCYIDSFYRSMQPFSGRHSAHQGSLTLQGINSARRMCFMSSSSRTWSGMHRESFIAWWLIFTKLYSKFYRYSWCHFNSDTDSATRRTLKRKGNDHFVNEHRDALGLLDLDGMADD